MVLEFSMGNFRSFNQIQKLDFTATKLVSEDKEVDARNIVEELGTRVLKTIAIYGPNGSGKSNLIKGFSTFRDLVDRSLESEAIMTFAADPFRLCSAEPDNAGFYQILLLIETKKYRYGFTLTPSGSYSKSGYLVQLKKMRHGISSVMDKM